MVKSTPLWTHGENEKKEGHREGGGGKRELNGGSKWNTSCAVLEMVGRCIWGFRYSDVCYGNPPFPWNLLETQEESFWLRSHDCTIFAGLIEWQKTQLIPLNTCNIRTHSTYSLRAGEKKVSCWLFLDTASHNNWSRVSLISAQVIHSPISSIPFILIISLSHHPWIKRLLQNKLHKMIMTGINNSTVHCL